MRPRNLATLALVLCLCSVAVAQTGVAWPEADRLFHSDPRWLGADGAYSIDLGHGRVLWAFSDSFVARRPGADRPHSAFIHNTVAIQSGYDPSQATTSPAISLAIDETQAAKPRSISSGSSAAKTRLKVSCEGMPAGSVKNVFSHSSLSRP